MSLRVLDHDDLLRDHQTCHAWFAVQNKGRQIRGWSPPRLAEHHRLLVAEMRRRGIRHSSPLYATKPGSLEALSQLMLQCAKCPQARFVPPEGPRNADIAIVGEAPGPTEATLQRPFVGVAGKRLQKVLDSLHLRRSEVYLTNALKCYRRGPPTRKDIANCRPYLIRELQLVKPRRIVALGRVAQMALGGMAARTAPHPVARVRYVSRRIRTALQEARTS